MINKILYRVLSALAALFCLCSCGLEEPFGSSQDRGVIEFVARPVGFNNQTVETKSAANDLENKVCNCYFLLFNSDGERVHISGGTASSLQSYRIPRIDGLTGTLTACYLVNVPSSFAKNIIGLTKPDGAPATDSYKYINTAVLEIGTYRSGTPMGVPMIDVSENNTPQVEACIPMFGKGTFTLTNNSSAIVCQVPIKRLFAKLTVNLSLNVNKENWLDDAASRLTYYKLEKYTLHNLPKKVRLEESTAECSWVSDVNSFAYATESTINGSGDINASIYNKSSSTNHEFVLYAPEYYLNPKELDEDDDGYMNQYYKPDNYVSTTFPIYITLIGYYSEYSYRSAYMTHKIYFGRDEHSDFSLARNTRYINSVSITGISKNATDQDNIDYRVTTEYINNPVAEAGESANCYIIGKTGDYSFPAYKGAFKSLQDGVFCDGDENSYVELIAKDKTGIVIESLDYDEDKNFISFNVSSITDGNAVIALKNSDGSIEWSWHLWCKTGSQYDIFGWGAIDNQDYSSGSTFMDRNLGATETTSITTGGGDGLTYKYGSKNPYFSTAYDANGDKLTSKYYGDGESSDTWDPNEDSNEADITKAVNDPCPPGYIVPPEGAWGPGASHLASTVVAFGYEVSIYYPYVGGHTSTTRDIIATGWERTTTEEKNSNETPSGLKYPKTRTQTRTQIKIYDVEYSAPMVWYTGNVWTSTTQKTYFYDYNMVDFTNLRKITDLSVNRYQEISRSVVVTQTKSGMFSSWKDDKTPTESDWSEWSSPQTKEYSYSFGDTWPALVLAAELTKEDEGIYYSTSSYASQSSTDLRYPIRCMVIPTENN